MTVSGSVLFCVEYGSTFCLFACLFFVCLFVCLFASEAYPYSQAILDSLSIRPKQAIRSKTPFVSLVQISRTYTNARNAAIDFNVDQERMKDKRVYIVVEPRSTRDLEMVFKLIDKVPEVGNTANTPNHLGIHPY